MPRFDERSELAKHERRALEYVAVRVAAEVVAACPRLALATAILLPCVARVVEAVAVELDRQLLLGPSAIHAPAAGCAVGHGEWELCVA
jgi:hypothetical protein